MKSPLKIQMLVNDVSVEELARFLGVSRRNVYNKLAGNSEWLVHQMWSVADYLGMDDKTMLECFPRKGGR